MKSFFQKKSLLFLILPLLSGCRGIIGLADTAEGVANAFLRDLYQLEFERLPLFSRGEALMQAAFMEGFADAFTEAERQRYQQSELLVIDLTFITEDRAIASYELRTRDAILIIQNSILLEREDRRWWVTSFTQPRIWPPIYHYFVN